MLQNKPTYIILKSGSTFFDDLLYECEQAQKNIHIRSFLWRNDDTGRRVAQALIEAANRGVDVYVVKDRIGAFFEYAESNGQSFFHDTPHSCSLFSTHSTRTMYWQSKAMAWLYDNRPRVQRPNPLAGTMRAHPRIHVIDAFKLYDHSKVIIIDGKIAYVGGIGFADEFMKSEPLPWLDFMFKTDDPRVIRTITQSSSAAGQHGNQSIQCVTSAACECEGSDLHTNLLAFISRTQNNITVVMPFFGEVDYIRAFVVLLEKGVNVRFITAMNPFSNRYRNKHFFKRLIRESDVHAKNLTISLAEGMVHGKLLLRDNETIRVGSQNMVMGSDVVRDTVIEARTLELYFGAAQALNDQLEHKTIREYRGLAGVKLFNKENPWVSIFLPSRVEWLATRIQSIIVLMRRKTIRSLAAQF